MGVSIDAHIYDVDEVAGYILDNSRLTDLLRADVTKWLWDNVEKFGAWVPNPGGPRRYFVIVWNEYYDEYNPEINFLHALKKVFGMNHSFFHFGISVPGGAGPYYDDKGDDE